MPRFRVVVLRLKVFLSVSFRLIYGRFRAELFNMAGSRRLPPMWGVYCVRKEQPRRAALCYDLAVFRSSGHASMWLMILAMA